MCCSAPEPSDKLPIPSVAPAKGKTNKTEKESSQKQKAERMDCSCRANKKYAFSNYFG